MLELRIWYPQHTTKGRGTRVKGGFLQGIDTIGVFGQSMGIQWHKDKVESRGRFILATSDLSL